MALRPLKAPDGPMAPKASDGPMAPKASDGLMASHGLIGTPDSWPHPGLLLGSSPIFLATVSFRQKLQTTSYSLVTAEGEGWCTQGRGYLQVGPYGPNMASIWP